MNKKFLSAILFGALMVTSTGTFVSCKDYDEEIEDLQGQISNLATKSDVEAKLAQLQAALEAAKAESTANAADIAALEKEVASMTAKVEAALEAEIAEFKAEIEALVKEVEDLVGKVADFVTSVELIDSYTAANGNYANEDRADLSFASAVVTADQVFGKDLTGELKFTKGDQVQTTDQFVVRVSPTNAVLTPEMISLVDSEGKNLDELLTITKVEKFNGVLGRAANTGLWTVTAQLTKYNATTFNAAALVKADDASKGRRLYAVQVNNAIESAEARYVSSSYDLTLNKGEFEIDSDLDFVVKTPLATKHVAEINNRVYNYRGYSFLSQTTDDYKNLTYKELAWATVAQDALKDNTIEVWNETAVKSDKRSQNPVILGVQGQDITISIVKQAAAASEYTTPSIAAMYVVLDKANAVESLGSEINAWNAYTYTGLNEVVKGTSTTIKVNHSASVNDIIGFRVFAVNHDGKLVDPDGRAFYVRIGEPAEELNVAETTITPINTTIVATEAVAVDAFAELEGVVNFKWAVDTDNVPFDLCFYKKNAENYFSRIANGATSTQTNINDVVKIASIPAINADGTSKEWYNYEDGKTYYGTLTAYDATGFEIATLRVSFTKNIPTAAPEGFSIKTNQVVNGVYNCYLIPMNEGATAEAWAAETAKTGTMAMDQIFNFPAESNPAMYSIKFATTKWNADNEAYTDVMPAAGNSAVKVAAELIDNETKHATTATYNYGAISSVQYAKHVADANVTADYIVEVPEVNFETVYNCIYNDTYSWAWATREQLALYSTNWTKKNDDGSYKYELPTLTLTYGKDMTKVAYNTGSNHEADLEKFIYGVSTKDSRFNAFLAAPYQTSSLKIVKDKTTFTSDANGKQEYFEPLWNGDHLQGLKFIPTASNPEADVPSTLTITVVDMYGHERVIKIAGTVKKN